jgi:hypothetical protein
MTLKGNLINRHGKNSRTWSDTSGSLYLQPSTMEPQDIPWSIISYKNVNKCKVAVTCVGNRKGSSALILWGVKYKGILLYSLEYMKCYKTKILHNNFKVGRKFLVSFKF